MSVYKHLSQYADSVAVNLLVGTIFNGELWQSGHYGRTITYIVVVAVLVAAYEAAKELLVYAPLSKK